MDLLDSALVTVILLAAASLLAWRLLRPGSKAAAQPEASDAVLKGALGEAVARAQRKRR